MGTTKQKVLLVDDQESVRKLLEAVLRVRSYDVCYASNGPEGIEVAVREQPDLILLDVMMPGMDGFKVCQSLKQGASTKHIPVVFLTARSDAADREMAASSGGAGLLGKPFRSAELLETIGRLLN